MIFVLLLSCRPPASVVDTGYAQDSGVQGWSWEGLSPSWTPEEVAAEVEKAVAYGLPQAEVVADNILSLLSRGDGVCPGHPSMISQPYVALPGCVADTGYQYRGILVYEEEETEDETGTSSSIFTSTADFEIIYPTGEIFFGGGSIRSSFYQSSNPEIGDRVMDLVKGVWQDPNHEVAWLSEGVSTYLSVSVFDSMNSDRTTAKIQGAHGIADIHLYFDHVEVESVGCERQPTSGQIWLRQPDTSWYQLHFDESCACPVLIWNQTEELGEVCLDLSPLVSQLDDFMDVWQ